MQIICGHFSSLFPSGANFLHVLVCPRMSIFTGLGLFISDDREVDRVEMLLLKTIYSQFKS